MPDKKRTERTEKHTSALDNEIKKALEYCSMQGFTSECEKCKMPKGTCRTELIGYALDLINRLQAETERLTIRLRKAEHQLDDLCIMHNVIKAEAYKEFAERLEKMMCYEHFFETDVVVLDRNKLNNLLKELVGDNK